MRGVGGGRLQAAEQVFRIIARRDQRDVLPDAMFERQCVDMAQRRVVLEREADRIEHRDLIGVLASRGQARQHAPELGHHKVGGQLLDVAFDPRLRLVLDDHARAPQHVGMQLGLAGAIAADRIDVHAGLDHLGGQDRRPRLVGGRGRDDLRAAHRLGRRGGADQAQPRPAGEVAQQLVGRGRIDIEDPDLVDAQQRVEGQRLEFALGAVADQRHAPRVGVRELARHQRGGRGGAQRGRQGQFRQQQRIAGVDLGEHAEGHHREQAAAGVARVAVDVLEREMLRIGHRHQLDHADL